MMEYPGAINERGLIDLDRLPHDWTDQNKFQYAIDSYIECKGNEVKGLTFTEPKVITDTLMIPAYFRFESNLASRDYKQKPGISVRINDPGKDGLVCVDKRGGNTSQPPGPQFINVFFEVHEPVRNFIDASNCMGFTADGIKLEVRGGEMANGFKIGSDEYWPRAIGTKITNCTIRGATDAAIHYVNCGNQHFIRESFIGKSLTGIKGQLNSLNVVDSSIENNSTPIELTKSSRIKIDSCYFDNGGIRLTKTHHLTFLNNKYYGDPITVNEVGSVVCTSNDFHNEPVRYEGDTQPHLEMKGNWFLRERFFRAFESSYRGDPVNVQGNFGDGWQQ